MNAFFSNWRRTLLLVFCLALLTRCAFILTQQNGFYFPDSTMDSHTALKLLSAGEFGVDFGRAPGYPVFLAVVYFLFGHSIFIIRLAESFMGAFLAVIIATIGRRIGGEIVGALAGVIWAVYPLGVFLAGLVYPTGLTAMFLACGAYCVLPIKHEELSAKKLFLGGIFLGLAALTIPVALLTIVFVAAWVFYWARQSRILLASVLVAGAIISLTPWTVRNFLVLGRVVPVQANFEGHFRKLVVVTPNGNMVVPASNSANEGMRGVVYRLELYATRMGRAFRYFWELYPHQVSMSDPGYRDYLHAQDSRIVKETIYTTNRLVNAVSILSTGPVFFFGLLGTVAMWLGKNLRRELSFLWVMALSFAIGYSFFYGKIRYRLPIEPYLIILSAYGLHVAYAMISARLKSAMESNGSVASRPFT
ncbi:MAG: ArnT family glycosyltransferase [Candidatus Binatia bacterium]